MPKIQFQNVFAYYQINKKSITALDDFSATFENNKINVLVGPSGGGKTTLFKLLCEIVAYKGNILFDENDMEKIPLSNRNIGYVSQEYNLYPHLNIFDNIAFPLKLLGAPVEEISRRVHQIAKDLGIEMCLTRKPKHLSGGQLQRVAIARALVKKPTICLLDEPLSNLEYEKAVILRALLRKLLSSLECTVLYITHDLSEALAIGDSITIIEEGKCKYQGTPKEILEGNNPLIKNIFTNINYEKENKDQ